MQNLAIFYYKIHVIYWLLEIKACYNKFIKLQIVAYFADILLKILEEEACCESTHKFIHRHSSSRIHYIYAEISWGEVSHNRLNRQESINVPWR